MAELVDALDSGSSGSNPVEVQVLLSAPSPKTIISLPQFALLNRNGLFYFFVSHWALYPYDTANAKHLCILESIIDRLIGAVGRQHPTEVYFNRIRTLSSCAVSPSVWAIMAHCSPISCIPCLLIIIIEDFLRKFSTLRGE